MHATSHDGGTIRAASLVRVSTKGQADKGLSLDEQDRRVAKYISDQEWTPAGGWHDEVLHVIEGRPRSIGLCRDGRAERRYSARTRRRSASSLAMGNAHRSDQLDALLDEAILDAGFDPADRAASALAAFEATRVLDYHWTADAPVPTPDQRVREAIANILATGVPGRPRADKPYKVFC